MVTEDKFIVSIIIVILMILLIGESIVFEQNKFGCVEGQQIAEELNYWTDKLPKHVTEIRPVGNGWVNFYWNGRNFLYCSADPSIGRTSVLIELSR